MIVNYITASPTTVACHEDRACGEAQEGTALLIGREPENSYSQTCWEGSEVSLFIDSFLPDFFSTESINFLNFSVNLNFLPLSISTL